ncbi:MAG TPA: ABC transporter ATP-binding protein [Bacteroidota bacterium]|nr:ABC transporter ATP-binding protein [Bacteroidota bacterium]
MSTIIHVEHLGKQYRIGARRRGNSFRDLFDEKVRSIFSKKDKKVSSFKDTIWALEDVSFDVQEGEVLGIIGRNGAGKSTLLKILARITAPTRGRIRLEGRIASLLEVGTGFSGELTGRENIFLNGAILGMKRMEIKRKFDEIVAFADMEKFIDTPVKHYSSGMYMRLAFAVAAHLEPEILIVDEVLAVGDIEFQRKCLGKLGDVATSGRTVLFVSHNTAAVQTLCKTGLLLAGGKLAHFGSAEECVAKYLQGNNSIDGTILSMGRQASGDVQVTGITINGSESTQVLLEKSEIEIMVQGTVSHDVKLDIEARLYSSQGVLIGSFCPTRNHGNLGTIKPGPFRIKSTMDLQNLNKGRYSLDVYLTHPMVQGYWDFPNAATLYCDGIPLANSSVLETIHYGPILLTGETVYQ